MLSVYESLQNSHNWALERLVDVVRRICGTSLTVSLAKEEDMYSVSVLRQRSGTTVSITCSVDEEGENKLKSFILKQVNIAGYMVEVLAEINKTNSILLLEEV